MKTKYCTKCGYRQVDPRYDTSKETGYCEPCAELLKLGEHGHKIIPKDFFLKKKDKNPPS